MHNNSFGSYISTWSYPSVGLQHFPVLSFPLTCISTFLVSEKLLIRHWQRRLDCILKAWFRVWICVSVVSSGLLPCHRRGFDLFNVIRRVLLGTCILITFFIFFFHIFTNNSLYYFCRQCSTIYRIFWFFFIPCLKQPLSYPQHYASQFSEITLCNCLSLLALVLCTLFFYFAPFSSFSNKFWWFKFCFIYYIYWRTRWKKCWSFQSHSSWLVTSQVIASRFSSCKIIRVRLSLVFSLS